MGKNWINVLTEQLQRHGLWLIIIIYLLLQLFHLGHRWVDDESWYLMPLPSIFEEGKFRIPTVPGDDVFWPQPPLLTYLEAGLSVFVPLNSYTARIIPLLFAVLLIIGTYSFCRRQFGQTAALLAIFFVAADNILFLTARTVRPDIMIGALQVLAIVSFARYLENTSKSSTWLCLSAVMAGLAVSSHPNGLLVPASLFICTLLLIPEWMNKVRVMFVWGIVFVISLLPFILWMLWHDHDNHYENIISHWTGRHGRFSGVVEEAGFLDKAWALITAEVRGRYLDFIQWPFRVHIGVAAVVAIFGGFCSKNKWVIAIAIIAIVHLLFYIFINNSNNSIRYLASMTPLLAILYGYWVAFFFHPGRLNKMIAGVLLFGLIGGSQFAGNLLYHWKFRQADFSAVVSELREEIPAGSTVYGGMSFWLGFQDTLYVPYMRTNWQKAVANYRPEYVIMDDWVMMGGWEDGEWRSLREELLSYLNIHGELVKKINNPFYGNLKLYRVSYQDFN